MATEGKPATNTNQAVQAEAPERKPPPTEFKVNGKRVKLRTRFPHAENADLLRLVDESTTHDTNTIVALLTKTIESWEFEGDPRVPESYGPLDILDEISVMSNAVLRYMQYRFERVTSLKN